MTIEGVFLGNAGFVEAHVISASLGLDNRVIFLIDTGASRTTVLDRDARRLKLDYQKLSKSDVPLTGIGGSIPCYLIPDSKLIFPSATGSIAVNIPLSVSRHPLEQFEKSQKTNILRMPSILGRDIIKKFNLRFDFPKRQVSLS